MDLKPAEGFEFTRGRGSVLLIACGALAREIVQLIEANRWSVFDVTCLPAKWHNTPDRITPAVREKIRANRERYDNIYVLYGDCGTGGLLDAMLAEEGVERIDGPHCYSFFSGNEAFAANGEDDVTAFYLTDYLAKHFDKLIWQGLGIDRHPELLEMYFGNYTHIIYLSQVEDAEIEQKARDAAHKLGLGFEHRPTGFGDLARFMADAVDP